MKCITEYAVATSKVVQTLAMFPFKIALTSEHEEKKLRKNHHDAHITESYVTNIGEDVIFCKKRKNHNDGVNASCVNLTSVENTLSSDQEEKRKQRKNDRNSSLVEIYRTNTEQELTRKKRKKHEKSTLRIGDVDGSSQKSTLLSPNQGARQEKRKNDHNPCLMESYRANPAEDATPKKHKKHKRDRVSTSDTEDVTQDLNALLSSNRDERQKKRKNSHTSHLVECRMTNHEVDATWKKHKKHKGNRLSTNDLEDATQENTLLNSSREERQKKRKNSHSSCLVEGYTSPEEDATQKKHKKHKRNMPRTDDVSQESTLLNFNQEERQQKRKNDHSPSLVECYRTDTEKDVTWKKQKHKKHKRYRVRTGDVEGASQENTLLSSNQEERQKKRKNDHSPCLVESYITNTEDDATGKKHKKHNRSRVSMGDVNDSYLENMLLTSKEKETQKENDHPSCLIDSCTRNFERDTTEKQRKKNVNTSYVDCTKHKKKQQKRKNNCNPSLIESHNMKCIEDRSQKKQKHKRNGIRINYVDNVLSSKHEKQQTSDLSGTNNIPNKCENKKEKQHRKKKNCSSDHKRMGYDINQETVEIPWGTIHHSSHLNSLDKCTSQTASQETNSEKLPCFEQSITEKLTHKGHKGKTQHKRGKRKCSSGDVVNGSFSEKMNEEARNLTNQPNCKRDENPDQLSDEDEYDIYDLAEEELTFEPPLLHFKGNCAPLTAEQKNQIREQGISVKHGKWTKKEDEILRQNWNQFAKKHKLGNPHLLLGLRTKKEPVVMKFIHAKNFYYELGKELNTRPIHSIYLRARKLFNPYNNNNDEVSLDLLEKIERLQSIYGNKWLTIGKALGRNYQTVSEIFRWHQKLKELGSWSEEEDKNLIAAIKKVLKLDDIAMVHQGIPWEEVAKLVPTRNAKQCRTHWAFRLCWDINNPNKTREKWSDVHTIHLVHCLYKSSAESEEDIDWIELHRKFPNVASYSALRGKWGEIKREVPRYAEKEFEDIVTYLYKVILPVLMKGLGKSSIEEVLKSS